MHGRVGLGAKGAAQQRARGRPPESKVGPLLSALRFLDSMARSSDRRPTNPSAITEI